MPHRSALTMGIIGGCLGVQPGIGRSHLYHQVLAKKLQEETGVRLRVLLSPFVPPAPITQRAAMLLDAADLDIIAIHVRPQPFLLKCKVIIQYQDGSGGKHAILNPNFTRPGDKFRWDPQFDPFPRKGVLPRNSGHGVERCLPTRKESQQSDANLLLGSVLGLGAKAAAGEIQSIERVKELCSRRGVHMAVMGPTSSLRSRVADRVCNDLSRKLEDALSRRGIPFVPLLGTHGYEGRNVFERDGLHFNEIGHALVAERLYEQIRHLPCVLHVRSSQHIPAGVASLSR
jgi:hypothetical protein